MGINTCSWIMDNDEPCGERTEGNTQFCGSHNRQLRKEAENESKSLQKRAQLLSKPKQVRKTISKNPKDWGNTFLCSNGNRVDQMHIMEMLAMSYALMRNVNDDKVCEGCGGKATCHAHIIPKARCKVIGKTELIWSNYNYFNSCFDCNSAIENPKGNQWKSLKNIVHCLCFIQEHDPELYMKFETSTTKEPHKI